VSPELVGAWNDDDGVVKRVVVGGIGSGVVAEVGRPELPEPDVDGPYG
jgi:hypothetical protein